MLFTTAEFAFLYLPFVAIGFFTLGRAPRAAATWLGLASIVFYGWWMPVYVALLLASIVANFFIGIAIGKLVDPGFQHTARREGAARYALIAGVAFNLGLLSWFKYAGFLLDTLRNISGLAFPEVDVVLPIGISFFSFTQIAFLVDTYKKGTREYSFVHYLLFVTYFPHLIAGPILHHSQMMPQFDNPRIYRPYAASISAGLSLFAIGLIKKLVLADSIAPYPDAIFDSVSAGALPTPAEAWIGALGYTLQLYFDFSGYSDMAVGLSMIFGIRLPFNFASPYRATNISEFWRRWHMTLSAFLKDYLYIPLGGNRLGSGRRKFNLMATMLLGGLWHGASWTFVAWGALHGLYLVVHHTFAPTLRRSVKVFLPYRAVAASAWLATMLAVIVAWVFFRASDFATAGTILSSMHGFYGGDGISRILPNAGLSAERALLLLSTGTLVALFPVNSNAIFEWITRATARIEPLTWMTIGSAATFACAAVIVNEFRSSTSPFIYFNF